MCEVITAVEVGAMLKLSKRSVYQLTCARVRGNQEHPLPMFHVNGNLRFIKQDVEAWITKLSQEQAQ
jgi:hypothetical protein